MRLPLVFKQSEVPYSELSALLEKCMKLKASKLAKQIHAVLLVSGIDKAAFSPDAKLLGVYATGGCLRYAKLVFNEMHNPSVFALNWMISATAFHGHYEEALRYFSLIRHLQNTPNKYTFAVVLKACVGLLDISRGKEVHAMINKMGLWCDVMVCNALVDMYSKCGKMQYARRIFDGMPKRDVATWTSIISGYCKLGKLYEAIVLFDHMKSEGVEPNDFTWNAMIAGYAQKGDCDGAMELLNRMKIEGLFPDLVTWNALISGFAWSNQAIEALKLFGDMLVSGIRPNHVTVTGLLPACGLTGWIHCGREVHCLIYRLRLELNVYVASALIDMYSRCGNVKDARNVFEKTPIRNVALWNAMIGCYGKHGLVGESIYLFDWMQKEGFWPNEVTLVCVLSACAHGGLIEKGLQIFRNMKDKHGVDPNKEHYSCVIDLLCRAGRVEEAYNMIKEMQMEITGSIAGAFFSGCKTHGRKDLAGKIAQDLLMTELNRPAGFVTLSNIYAADGEWEEVENLRKLMKDKRAYKRPGFSSVDKSNGSVEF